MKTILFILFLIISVTIHAQTDIKNLTSVEKTNIELSQAKEQLQLTAEQEVRYEKIIKKYNNLEPEISKLQTDTSKRIEKRTALIFQRSAEVKAILTKEQYAQYSKWMGLGRLQEIEKNKVRVDSLRRKN